MFQARSDRGYHQVIQGIDQKTLVYGDKTLMARFVLGTGSTIPLHSHPHEQTGYLVSGRLRLSVGGEMFDATAGDSWCIPGGVEHRVEVLEDSVAIEVFSPVREDYLPR